MTPLAFFTGEPRVDLLIAGILVIVGLGLLVLEFFIVSAGMLAIGGVVCVAIAIAIAFDISLSLGIGAVIVLPLVMIAVARWGLRRMQSSSLVTQAVIDSDAGYHHLTQSLGITIGARGVMVTAARPTGRARFDGGECDVSVVGTPLMQGLLSSCWRSTARPSPCNPKLLAQTNDESHLPHQADTGHVR